MTRKIDECEWALCVRDYHVFCEIWEAAVGEVLTCEREPRNAKDGYAVAVKWTELSLRIASCTSLPERLPIKTSRMRVSHLSVSGTLEERSRNAANN